MPASPKLQLKVTQKLQLAPQVRHAIALMQLTRIELIGHIKQVAESNPLIDLDTLHPDGPGRLAENGLHEYHTNSARSDVDPMQWVADTSQSSLAEHLRWQAHHAGLTTKEHALALGIIDHIDDRGLLSTPVDEITQSLKMVLQDDDVQASEIQGVLEKVQRFDPPGVGAFTVQEALSLQLLMQHQKDPRHALAHHLIQYHFESLGRGNLKNLSRLLRVDEPHIQSAFELIQSLNPHPGSGFGDLDNRHIIPDLYIHLAPNGDKSPHWQVTFNHTHIPTLCVNDTYDRLFEKASATDRAYLNKKHKEANTLIEALALRHQTLVRVARALIGHQSRFLSEGPRAMQPLKQATLAQELGVHVSTISRSCKQKYAQTPQGIIELRSLFSGEIPHEAEGVIANKAIQHQILDLIGKEDKQAPLSDQAIATHLGSKGVRIARRTVTKYREKMGIDGSRQRRNMHNWAQ